MDKMKPQLNLAVLDPGVTGPLHFNKGNIQSHYRHCQLTRALLILRSKAISRYMNIRLLDMSHKINSSHQTLCIAQFTKRKKNMNLRSSINNITC